MLTIAQDSVLANLPTAELKASLSTFLTPVTDRLPDARLPAVAELMVHGIIASQSPLITQIARGAGYDDASIWPTSKRAYWFLENERFSHRLLLITLAIRTFHHALSVSNSCLLDTPPALSCSTAFPRSPRTSSAFQSTRFKVLDTTYFFAASIVRAKGSIQSGIAPLAGDRNADSIIS